MTAWKLYCETCGDNDYGVSYDPIWNPQMRRWFDVHEAVAHPDSPHEHVQVIVPLSDGLQRV
jgi:hypothetical protein